MSDLFAAFELVERGGMRQFARAPTDLRTLLDSARRHGPATLVVEGDRRLTYAEVFARADALAAALDIAPGERVAIAMRNCAEWMIGFLAIVRAGGIAVLVNSRGGRSSVRETCQLSILR
ncbi:AMP-binding protein [Leptolyngbya sp. 15MV]|nr:AMP-binding protein [Leptolyngbya sp. 15MV]